MSTTIETPLDRLVRELKESGATIVPDKPKIKNLTDYIEIEPGVYQRKPDVPESDDEEEGEE